MHYLATQLQACGINRLVGVTGAMENPTQIAWRFSPVSNDKRAQVALDQELDVLIATGECSIAERYSLYSALCLIDFSRAVIYLSI